MTTGETMAFVPLFSMSRLAQARVLLSFLGEIRNTLEMGNEERRIEQSLWHGLS